MGIYPRTCNYTRTSCNRMCSLCQHLRKSGTGWNKPGMKPSHLAGKFQAHNLKRMNDQRYSRREFSYKPRSIWRSMLHKYSHWDSCCSLSSDNTGSRVGMFCKCLYQHPSNKFKGIRSHICLFPGNRNKGQRMWSRTWMIDHCHSILLGK